MTSQVFVLTGNECQRSAHQVKGFRSVSSIIKSLERAEKSNTQGLAAFCSLKHIPRRQRTKRPDGGVNAINSGMFQDL